MGFDLKIKTDFLKINFLCYAVLIERTLIKAFIFVKNGKFLNHSYVVTYKTQFCNP
jgi:hypothetical protein